MQAMCGMAGNNCHPHRKGPRLGHYSRTQIDLLANETYQTPNSLGRARRTPRRSQGNLAKLARLQESALNLPTPSLCDHMLLPPDLPLPCTPLFEPSPNPSLIEAPRAFFDSFGLLDPIQLPDGMLPAYLEHQPRRHRAWWFRQYYAQCLQAFPRVILPMCGNWMVWWPGSLFSPVAAANRFSSSRGPISSARNREVWTFPGSPRQVAGREHLATLMLLGSNSRYLLGRSHLGWEEVPAYCARHLNLHAWIIMLLPR